MREKELFNFDLVDEYVMKKEMHRLIFCGGRGFKRKRGAELWSRGEVTTGLVMGPTEVKELEKEWWL